MLLGGNEFIFRFSHGETFKKINVYCLIITKIKFIIIFWNIFYNFI